MKQLLMMMAGLTILHQQSSAFCGFYVSKASGTLKNKTSQVIMARDGDRNVITMYNDFKGDFKDFAMVVPVPVVLQKKDVKVVSNSIFDRLDDYSAPRLVEYYDQNPCQVYRSDIRALSGKAAGVQVESVKDEVMLNAYKKKVTIEAQYTVGEYDILILSAKESSGLKTWLTENGYQIPANAEEVLDPYIKSNLKFFVVKVNLDEKKKTNNNFLSPLQIKFSSSKFMLPIRLGMANADGDQDMVVYAFTKSGRVETTNYRNVSVPTAKNIPLFVQNTFARFYGDLFENVWAKEGKSAAFLEYAWDVSPANYVKCDPCTGNPPGYNELVEAGVWWIQNDDYENYVNEYEADKGKVFFTRLHVRYNRQSFAQDLMFQTTPNTENFQARYIITHPASGDMSCAEGKKYLKELKEKRKKEMKMLGYLTGKGMDEWNDELAAEMDEQDDTESMYAALAQQVKKADGKKSGGASGLLVASMVLLGSVGFMRWKGIV
jgi:hypothetical protein